MNIQRFTAPTSREAMAKARNAFGETAVILSTRSTDSGFEVMAAAEESLASLGGASKPAARNEPEPARSRQIAQPAPDSVEADTETMSMSTLSFQDYVRERMLRKRRAALQGDTAQAEPPAAPAAVARQVAPRAEPMQIPVPRMSAPVARVAPPAPRAPMTPMAPMAPPPTFMSPMPAPIRTRAAVPLSWEDSLELEPPRAQADSQVAGELSALKEMIEEKFNTLAWLGASKQNPIQSQLMLKMIRAGFSPAISRAVLERVPVESNAGEAVRWLMDVITRNLKVAAPGAGLVAEGGVISLIGATGIGKTTTAAKLAAQCVQQFGAASVGLITLDSYRVSGFEQLRAYGRMLGVVAHQAHDRAALSDLLNLLANKRMVIIDTAGLAQRDQRIQDMLDVLNQPKIKKVLVVNAGAHGDTLDDVFTGFKASTLHGVVLSKVDEAVKLGPALDALLRHQVTLRGVANGQRVPEDWQVADAAALVRMAMSTEGKSAHDPLASDMGFYFSQASTRGIHLGAGCV
jgi:flagellar biosynthesis protein FlhF